MEKISYQKEKANPLYHLTVGIRFYFAGFRALFRSGPLLGLSLIPIIITFFVLMGLALAIAFAVGEMIGSGMANQARALTQALIFVLALLIGYFIYLPLARVLLAPFSEAISRKAHAINTGRPNSLSSLNWWRAMREGLKLIAFQTTIVLAALALGIFFPPVGAPLGLATAVFICGLDFLDVPLSVRGWSLRHKLGLIWGNKFLTIGFGAAAYLTLLIPLVNVFSLPVGVIGATLLIDSIEND